MKYSFLFLVFCIFVACKNETASDVKMSKVDIINNTTITPELVDSLSQNRIERLSDFRKDVGYHCGEGIIDAFLYFKIKIDSNGKYSEVEVPEKDGLNHVSVQECIIKYLEENNPDLGIIREMPDSKYGAVPRVKTYTLRVY